MNSSTNATFRPMTLSDIPLYLEWAKREHVKSTWFFGGYEPVDYIHTKVAGNGHDFPFVILVGEQPVGYIQYCDLFAYRQIAKPSEGLFIGEPKGGYCMDLFIAEEALLGRGVGTQVVRDFSDFILAKPVATRVLADPSIDNPRSIRCFEKAGFHKIGTAFDDTCDVAILEKTK